MYRLRTALTAANPSTSTSNTTIMHALLTWPTYGTWLPGPSHGRTERCCGSAFILPEPDRECSAPRRGALKWPAVSLSERHRAALKNDLPRIESIRGFTAIAFRMAEDHVHLLFVAPDDADPARLVQLIKGTLARALSVAEGDRTAVGVDGAPLPHQKWWGRQHVLQILADDESLDAARQSLDQAHPGRP